MTCHLLAVCFPANRPRLLARFWAGLLGWEPADGDTLLHTDGTGFRIRFVATDEPKVSQNRTHFDLTSGSLADQQRTVDRALELGGRHIDIGQRPEDEHVVLADPEGNEFCVIEPGNRFLAGTGFIGALNCDGSQQVGYFWSAALEWPLVWDENQETAIQSPHGGPKITWSGPPLMPRTRRDVRFELAPAADGDQRAEVDRLLSLGATRLDSGRDGPCCVALADPDGNEFHVRAGPG